MGGGFLAPVSPILVGLIPSWGIVPKVAVSNPGTYVVGHVVLQWYLTGRRLNNAQMRAIYAQSLEGGKEFALRFTARMPRPKLGMCKT